MPTVKRPIDFQSHGRQLESKSKVLKFSNIIVSRYVDFSKVDIRRSRKKFQSNVVENLKNDFASILKC